MPFDRHEVGQLDVDVVVDDDAVPVPVAGVGYARALEAEYLADQR